MYLVSLAHTRGSRKTCGHPAPQTKIPPSAPHLPNNILALYLGQQALERCGESVLCSCMPAPASSGTAPASSGEVVKISHELRRSWILVHNVFLWSFKVKIYILGVFGALCQFRRILPELAGAGYAITSNRINHQVLVLRSKLVELSPELMPCEEKLQKP